MAYPKHIWLQLKGLTADRVIAALKKDGWQQEAKKGATLGFFKAPRRRIVIHYHPNKTYGANLLTGLLDDIGWSVADMKRLKLIKKK